jgi:hypothetical protein
MSPEKPARSFSHRCSSVRVGPLFCVEADVEASGGSAGFWSKGSPACAGSDSAGSDSLRVEMYCGQNRIDAMKMIAPGKLCRLKPGAKDRDQSLLWQAKIATRGFKYCFQTSASTQPATQRQHRDRLPKTWKRLRGDVRAEGALPASHSPTSPSPRTSAPRGPGGR